MSGRLRQRKSSPSGLLATKQTALFLYSVLVVLPAVVFGGLHWHQLNTDHHSQLDAVPADARDAIGRVMAGIEDRLDDLIEGEDVRPFFHYQDDFFTEGTTEELAFLPSPLTEKPPPPGVDLWFSYDFLEGRRAQISIYDGTPDSSSPRLAERQRSSDLITQKFVDIAPAEQLEIELTRPSQLLVRKVTLRTAAVNRSPHRDVDCLRVDVSTLASVGDLLVDVQHSPFRLRLMHDELGEPRLVASRRVTIEPQPEGLELPPCFEAVERRTFLVQGFFLDLDWLFAQMPRQVADRVLEPSQRFLLPGHGPDAIGPADVAAEINFFDRHYVEIDDPIDRALGAMKVAVNRSQLESRFRAQILGFLSVAAVMVVSLAVGMGLLVRSVRASLDQARQMENFVSAVTHELRTPIAAVKMYGEMLRDGWLTDPAKKADYLTRIVRESDRLDTLVDRVLEKRRLGTTGPEPEAGDLSALIEAQIRELTLSKGTYGEDLSFELAADLPPVLLLEDALHSIIVNLIENARKYAPVAREAEGELTGEPILIETRLAKNKVVLEVSDRGSGIPESERVRVFEAFYRVGDERTRTASGTGLGLHLVALQARSMKARAQALARRGGGTTFRITFKTARASSA